jgi:quercetin dioxygenase-like cupin family protein
MMLLRHHLSGSQNGTRKGCKMATVHRFNGTNDIYEWKGVNPQEYDGDDFVGVVKQVLIGREDGAPNFVIRYFRIEPGGHSQLESHPHDHGVVILHGIAQVQLNDEILALGPLDVVYVGGNDIHQFKNVGEEDLGFICVIPPIE